MKKKSNTFPSIQKQNKTFQTAYLRAKKAYHEFSWCFWDIFVSGSWISDSLWFQKWSESVLDTIETSLFWVPRGSTCLQNYSNCSFTYFAACGWILLASYHKIRSSVSSKLSAQGGKYCLNTGQFVLESNFSKRCISWTIAPFCKL